jgi:hypothetical protein
MFKWTVKLHNNVNRRNKKRVIPPEKARNIYVKNGNLVIKNGMIIRFLREFVAYNFRFNNWKRENAFRLMRMLVDIYPSPKKRAILQAKFEKKPPRHKWLKIFVNTLKK